MPERNILRIYGTWSNRSGEAEYCLYSPIDQHTGRILNLCPDYPTECKERLIGDVHAILRVDGTTVTIVGESYSFDARKYQSQYIGTVYAVWLPSKLVLAYGIREDEFLDVTFTDIVRPKTNQPEELYPRILRYGERSITPKSGIAPQPTQMPTVLIDHKFATPYFSALALEINYAYGFNLMRSTMILYRTLLENLLIELLRNKYGIQQLSLFFDTSHNRFHDFSVLITSLKDHVVDFQPYTTAIDTKFCSKLDSYRETGNAQAHKLENTFTYKEILERRTEMNTICELLVNTIHKISQSRL